MRILATGALLGVVALALSLAPESAQQPASSPLATFDFRSASTGRTVHAQSIEQHPTVRLFATRQGLVGRRTANGHIIQERDRFVALPSWSILNPLGANDYQVRIEYQGRSVVAPVWDVGPWNTRDNFWDEDRKAWPDLPRFFPQAMAAYFYGHNGGMDERGRRVTIPVSIDIADGTFWDDLGMVESDWVDVTFLWLEAPSPPPLDLVELENRRREVAARATEVQSEAEAPRLLMPGRRWFLADGSAAPSFHTWLLLQNPGESAVSADITYMLASGETRQQQVRVAARSRASILANQVLDGMEFAARVDADGVLLVERSIYHSGGGHTTLAAADSSRTWFFSEGSTQLPFDTWLDLQNPNGEPVEATIHLWPEQGQEVAHALTLVPTSRRSVQLSTLLSEAGFAIQVTADQPIVAERSIYRGSQRDSAGSLGAPSTARTWYFAEGDTSEGRDTWLLLHNPGDVPLTAHVRYLREDGGTLEGSYQVQPRSRSSIYVNSVVHPSRFGISVEAEAPLVAERAMFFGAQDGGARSGSHATLGSPRLAHTWFLPEGSTAEPFQSFILIANPGDAPAVINVELMGEDSGLESRGYEVAPAGRLTVDLNSIAPGLGGVSARVSSDQPVVVERSMYQFGQRSGTNSIGIAWE